MYWIDIPSSSDAKIERASMDGKNRQCLHSDDLGSPRALTLDYQTQILYWYDDVRGTIESSSVDGSNKSILINLGAYSDTQITVYEGILYWSKKNSTDAGIWSANVSSAQVMDTELLLSLYRYCVSNDKIQVINEERQYKCEPTSHTIILCVMRLFNRLCTCLMISL